MQKDTYEKSENISQYVNFVKIMAKLSKKLH